MERFGRWIIFQGLCKGICKFSGRIADATEKLCRCTSAFHTALPCHQYGGYPVILRKPAGIHHSADIEYGNYFRETGCYLLHHGFFFLCQIEITLSFAVPSFPGKTADGNDCRVRIISCRLTEFIRKFRLYSHSRCYFIFILFFHIFLVKGSKFLTDTHSVL